MEVHEKQPKDIVGVLAQIIAPTLESLPSVWPATELKKKYISCDCAQAFTGAGSLFPARWYTDELFNKKKAMGLAETADDLWLNAMSLFAGVKTTLICHQRVFVWMMLINEYSFA